VGTPTFKEWLNTSVNSIFVSYQSASSWCKAYPVKVFKEYRSLKQQHKLPAKFPSNPEKVYVGRGWSDWFAFLRKVDLRGSWTYEECTQHIMSIPAAERPTNEVEYRLLAKKTPRLPSRPSLFFHDKWNSLGGLRAFLGTTRSYY
jgi:hypothetical protein